MNTAGTLILKRSEVAALQDAAAAITVHETAVAAGLRVNLAE